MTYRTPWHTAHLIFTILTAGLWLIIWVWRANANNKYNKAVDMNLQTEQNELLKRIVCHLEEK